MANPRASLDFLHEGRVARLTLRAPKANVLNAEMIADLESGVRQINTRGDICAVVLTAEGPHFSFGASVEEHLPDRIRGTLTALHTLIRHLLEIPAPTIAAVRGQCLGGGFELALACDLLIAEETASFACPEIKLGVFPPAASALLPVRVGSARAAAMTITGEPLSGTAAAAAGLASRVAPAGGLDRALEEWLSEAFLRRSVPGLRFAAAAIRAGVRDAIDASLYATEQLYLNGLMRDPDAVEGIHAFLDKREPHWTIPAAV